MILLQEEINKSVDILREGGTILYPTDTVWGLGCDATNIKAVQRIFDIKKRADSKAMILLIDSLPTLNLYVKYIPSIVYQLIQEATKPLTIIYPKGKNLAINLLGEGGSIAIRIATDDFSQKLCKALGKPIVSTSANMSGQETPRLFSEIAPDIIDKVEYVVKHRQKDSTTQTTSTIIRVENDNRYTLIRQ